ncbi:MAG: hypothetical protein VYC82_07405 [Verrucomicrobiota bacterium]|nr:hypothetical protein [Verrucomicrobiota bacterium]
MEEKGISYQYREVPMLVGWKLPLRNYLEMKSLANEEKTVPQIIIDYEHYGDEERLFAGDKDGTLDKALRR